MINIAILSMIIFLCGCAAQKNTSFIPASPLTQEEIDEHRKQFESDPEWADYTFEDVFGNGQGMFRYREEDIRAALPEIDSEDKQLSLCSNSIMSGATAIVFSSKLDNPNRILLKTASCGPVEGGLACDSVSEERKYIYKDIFFNLGSGFKYEEAVEVLAVFESKGIDNLPEWHRKVFGFKSVNAISKTMEGYLIGAGEVFCGGCVTKIIVKPELSPESKIIKLNYVDAINSICI